MTRRRSAKTLVREHDFDTALAYHLNENYAGPLDVPSLTTVHAALCYASIGEGDKLLDLDGKPMTAAQVVEEFGLGPFVPLMNDRSGEISYPVGGQVKYYGDVCRVIGRRSVTILAMPREDDFELFIESATGEPMYFVGESMVRLLTDEDGF
jgi:hypothetical protein